MYEIAIAVLVITILSTILVTIYAYKLYRLRKQKER